MNRIHDLLHDSDLPPTRYTPEQEQRGLDRLLDDLDDAAYMDRIQKQNDAWRSQADADQFANWREIAAMSKANSDRHQLNRHDPYDAADNTMDAMTDAGVGGGQGREPQDVERDGSVIEGLIWGGMFSLVMYVVGHAIWKLVTQ